MLFSVAALGLLAGVAAAAPTRNATTKPQGAVSKITLPPEENATTGHLVAQAAFNGTFDFRYKFFITVVERELDSVLRMRATLTPVFGHGGDTTISPRPISFNIGEVPTQIDMQRWQVWVSMVNDSLRRKCNNCV